MPKQGIKQLMAAEKEAVHVVANARKSTFINSLPFSDSVCHHGLPKLNKLNTGVTTCFPASLNSFLLP